MNAKFAISHKGQFKGILPGITASIPTGSRYKVDLLKAEVLENTMKPQIEHHTLEIHDGSPTLGLSVAIGPTIKLKVVPGLPNIKLPGKCLKPFNKALNKFLNKVKEKYKDAYREWWGKFKNKHFSNPKEKTLAKINRLGFSDPLAIGGKLDMVRLDYNIIGSADAAKACNSEKAINQQAIYRIGFTPYINIFAWKVDISWIGKIDPSKVVTMGLYYSKELWHKCTLVKDLMNGVTPPDEDEAIATISGTTTGIVVMAESGGDSGIEALDLIRAWEFAREGTESAMETAERWADTTGADKGALGL